MKLSTHIAHCVQHLALHGDGNVELRTWAEFHGAPTEPKPLVVADVGVDTSYGIYRALKGQFE